MGGELFMDYLQKLETKRTQATADKRFSEIHSEKLAHLSSIEQSITNSVNLLIKYLDGKVTKTEVVNQLDSIATPDVQNVVNAVLELGKDVQSINFDTKPVVEALNSLKTEIKLIPSKMPKQKAQKDTIKVSNLSEIKLDTTAIEKAINNLKLQVPKVEAPSIDTTPIAEALSKLDHSKSFDISQYRAHDILEYGDEQYIGFVRPDGKWYIIENKTKENKLRYVFGDSDYMKAFTDAPMYDYKLLSEAINEI